MPEGQLTCIYIFGKDIIILHHFFYTHNVFNVQLFKHNAYKSEHDFLSRRPVTEAAKALGISRKSLLRPQDRIIVEGAVAAIKAQRPGQLCLWHPYSQRQPER
jgi:hypothetical protein